MSELERPYFPESVNHIIRAIGEGSSGGGGTEHAELLGVSTDEKPTNVPKYSMFLELDTLDIYYYGEDGWAKCGESGGGNYLLESANKTGMLQYDAIYDFQWSTSDPEINQSALSELLNTAAQNETPLVLTCPEIGVENLELAFDNEFAWTDGDVYIYIDIGDNILNIQIPKGELTAPTLNATFTLSFPEPEA